MISFQGFHGGGEFLYSPGKENAPMTKTDSLNAVSRIDGWLSDSEAEALYEFARTATGPIVEIGSCYGRSTAALALGSMAGNKHPVFAVDSFVGVPDTDRITNQGNQAGRGCSSPELLRANLDAAGVNGLVRIIPKGSAEALAEVPDGIGVLFVDGDHEYQSVLRDIAMYAPKVRLGGTIMAHDAVKGDPGVVKALDETLSADTARWLSIRRVDSSVIFERRLETERARVALAMPGPTFHWGAVTGMATATRGANDVTPLNSGNGWDDMQICWVNALNMAHQGIITHFAMLHSDIHPSIGWVDILAAELTRLGADMISTAVALKHSSGLTSSGIGDKDDHWSAFRRFTMRELYDGMPETFSIADTPHPDRYLLHNTGCWMADLRNPAWRTVDADNMLIASLAFPIAAQLMPDGTIESKRESEDWYFSRKIAALPLKTCITRKVSATHFGTTPYPNNRPWGDSLFGDDATRGKWGAQ